MHIKHIFFVIFTNSIIKFARSEPIPIVAQTLTELRRAGWSIVGSTPSVYEKPGGWKAALKPLDDDVKGWETWRVTSSNPTTFRFVRNGDLCNLNSVSLKVRYFSDWAVVTIYPCQLNPFSRYCYADPNPSGIAWQDKHFVLNSAELGNGIDIQLTVTIIPGGYIFFDQVIIEHDGIPCSSTTTLEPSTTSEEPTTITDIPSTTVTWVTETGVTEDTEPPTTVSDDGSTTTEVTTTTESTTEATTVSDIIITEDPGTTTTDNSDWSTSEEPSTEETTTESTTLSDGTTLQSTTSEIPSTSDIPTTETLQPTSDVHTTTVITTEPTSSDLPTTAIPTTVEITTDNPVPTTTTVSSTAKQTVPQTTDIPTTTDTDTTTESILPIIPTSKPSTTTIDPAVGDGRLSFSPEEIALYFGLPSVLGILALALALCCCALKGLCCWRGSGLRTREQLLVDQEKNRNKKNAEEQKRNFQQREMPDSRQVSRSNSNVSYLPNPSYNQQHHLVNPNFNAPQRSPVNLAPIPRTQPSPGFQGSALLPGPPPLPPRNQVKSVTLNIPEMSQGGSFSRPSSIASSRGGRIMYTGDYTAGESPSEFQLPRMRRKLD